MTSLLYRPELSVVTILATVGLVAHLPWLLVLAAIVGVWWARHEVRVHKRQPASVSAGSDKTRKRAGEA